MTTLNQYLDDAKKALSAVHEKQVALDNARQQSEMEWHQFVLDEIGALLPEPLRPYLCWGFEDTDNCRVTLHLQLPECTRINVIVSAQPDDEDRLRFAELSKRKWYEGSFEVVSFRVARKWDDREYRVEETVSSFGELDLAIARAAEIGEHWTDVMLEVDEKNAALKVEREKEARTPVCPLMSQGETVQKCIHEKCGWFICWRGVDECAIKVIGHAADQTLPLES